MATGPTGPVTQDEYDEMMDEGCRLARELKLADTHIDNMEFELTKYKDKVYDLECECAVFKAERDQADEMVLKQDSELETISKQRNFLLKENEGFITQVASLKQERDQATAEVLRQAKDINDLKQQRDDLLEEVNTLKENLQEWTDFEGWRQGRWVMVQNELKRLREEIASLKEEGKRDSVPDVEKS